MPQTPKVTFEVVPPSVLYSCGQLEARSATGQELDLDSFVLLIIGSSRGWIHFTYNVMAYPSDIT